MKYIAKNQVPVFLNLQSPSTEEIEKIILNGSSKISKQEKLETRRYFESFRGIYKTNFREWSLLSTVGFNQISNEEYSYLSHNEVYGIINSKVIIPENRQALLNYLEEGNRLIQITDFGGSIKLEDSLFKVGDEVLFNYNPISLLKYISQRFAAAKSNDESKAINLFKRLKAPFSLEVYC
jgi:hypothetical protein